MGNKVPGFLNGEKVEDFGITLNDDLTYTITCENYSLKVDNLKKIENGILFTDAGIEFQFIRADRTDKEKIAQQIEHRGNEFHKRSRDEEITNSSISSKKVKTNSVLLEESALFVCDIQEVFREKIVAMPSVIHGANYLIRVCKELNIPIVLSEQMPEKLGPTVSEIKKGELKLVYSKSKFSMLTNQVEEFLQQFKPRTVFLVGIEAHVCILQTSLELLSRGIKVYVVVDAVSSQKESDRKIAFKRLEQSGCILTTYESLAFELVGDSAHPSFKKLFPLFKQERPDPKLDFL